MTKNVVVNTHFFDHRPSLDVDLLLFECAQRVVNELLAEHR